MLTITPNIKFKKELKKLSNSSLNECMQCGNCSVVCTLAPDEKPFPRKEMIWAGWGMKENLIGNVDIWLCHQCGDCSEYCPRDVNPADVLASVRQLSYQHYAKPHFLSKILSKPVWLPIAVLIPTVIIAVILYMAGTLHIPEGEVNYSKFFPHAWLNSSFSFITLSTYLLASFGLIRFWNDMKVQFPETKPGFGILRGMLKILKEVLLHTNFGKCKTQKSRKVSHFLVFWGFILLLVVTIYAIYATFTHQYPLSYSNPFKKLGHLAATMLLIGLGIMIYSRLFNKSKSGHSNYADWLFLISMFLLTLSGIFTDIARSQNWSLAYHIYFFHLISIWFIVIYLPYTKFGHVFYRIVAMSFAKSIGRE
ncbi:MAG: hypothetical protein GXO79_01980 [Chlorobi bacterium]|nr:hypothetical protein [Chlorobiota bacterium]